jgi:anthranilate synthase component 1
MDKKQFEQLAGEGFNRIPVSRQILADLDTPLSAYLKLARKPFSYLFESVQGGEKWGRYSIIGLPSKACIKVFGNTVHVQDSSGLTTLETADPLTWIESYQKQFKLPKLPGMPRFSGGLVGYFAYDAVRYIEPKLGKQRKSNSMDTPDIMLIVSEEVVVFDNLSGSVTFLLHVDPRQANAWKNAQNKLDEWVAKLRTSLTEYPLRPMENVAKEQDFTSRFSQQAYLQGVAKIKDYIVAGDVMQVVLSQCMTTPYKGAPLDVYRALRSSNPSPYMFYLDMDDFQIVGSSPEILVRLENDLITVRPLAGTRPRGKDENQDQSYERELLADPKELAEHLMLIDLGRNDVGRIAEVGSVHVTEKMLIERYSHVMHIVSNVTGQLKKNTTALDVLKACFPAGTVSGAPKIRAMEIIDELEPTKRGIYAGAVGYLDWSGNMDTAIAIRTAVIKDKMLAVQAGAGIVADSVPENEWQETLNKGRAIFTAVAMAQQGLK